MRRTVVILVHEHATPFWRSTYTAVHLARLWQRAGLEVVVARGPSRHLHGDIVINHVDLTVTPPAYRDYLAEHPVVVNGRLLDISKPAIGVSPLGADTDYDGPVIVKTRANFGGANERDLAAHGTSSWRRRLERVRARVRRLGGWRSVRWLDPGGYPIFDSVRAVPSGVWDNAHLLVERFRPEPADGGGWHLRAWSFLGNRSLHVRATASEPVVRGAGIWRREILADAVPPQLVRVRERLGADYGRFDYGLVEGEPVLYDVNRTPTMSPGALQAYGTRLADLAAGLADF